MLARAKRWLNPYPDTPGALRLGFVAAYIGVVGALVVYSNAVSPCTEALPAGREWLMSGLLAALLFIERFELGRDTQPTPRRWAIGLLLARVALVQGVVMLDCVKLAVLLYAVVPFAVYFVLGAGASRLVELGYWAFVAAQGDFSDSADLQTILNSLTIVVIFTLLLIFVHVIAGQIDRDQRSRQQMRRLLSDLETSHRQLQAYASQVAALAAAAERNRLARDIHDSLGHYLTAISIQLEKAQAYRARDPEAADQAIRDAKQTARSALQDVRQSVSTLRDAEERHSPQPWLAQSLADLVGRMAGGSFEITCQVTGDEADYAGPVLTALYRAAQEGLTNVQKHARARHVLLDVQLGEVEARLKLHDDGTGFDADALAGQATGTERGYGLQGLRERLELVRGQMCITSNGQNGTELVVTVPKHLGQLGVT